MSRTFHYFGLYLSSRGDWIVKRRWLLMNSVWAYALAVVFGIIIFIVPAIVAYLVALFLIVFGVVGIVHSMKKG
jgi:hypothetical protein